MNVVLLDVNTPALSGDALAAVARRHAPPRTGFLLYTSNDEAMRRALAKKVGADGYISKSVDPSRLLDLLRGAVNAAPRTPA